MRLTPHVEALRAELERVLDEALAGSQQVLSLYANHDLALPALRNTARTTQRLNINLRFARSLDALRALSESRCTVAGFHVPPLPPEGSARYAQRQPGSASWLLTQHLLPEQLHGICTEDSHTAVAAAGLADAGIGVAAVAQAYGLAFVSLARTTTAWLAWYRTWRRPRFWRCAVRWKMPTGTRPWRPCQAMNWRSPGRCCP